MIAQISDKEYFSSVGLNASALKEFAKSPAHYQAYVNKETRKESDAFRIGSQAHKYILENAELNIKPACDRRTKAGKEIMQQFTDSLKFSTDYVDDSEMEALQRMKENILSHPQAAMINNPEWAEKAAFVTCPQTGLELKCKYDCLPDQGNIIYDLKTCKDASPDLFKWDAKKLKYDIQAAHYMYIAELLDLKMDHFVFVCVEKEAPYGVSAIVLDPETLHHARQRYFNLLNKFAECKKEDNFEQCYSNQIESINFHIN